MHGGGRWRGPGSRAIEIGLQPHLRNILITVGHKVPVLPLHQRGKESTGILTPDNLGVLGEDEEGEPIAVTLPDQALRLSLHKEGEEASGVLQIVGNDVTQSWKLEGGRRAGFLDPLLYTSRGSAGGGGYELMRWGWCGAVRLSSRLLMLKFLQGLLVFLRKGW